MDTRRLSFLGLGALGAIIVVTLTGVPPAVWITLALVGVGIGITFVIREAQTDGVDVANHIVAANATRTERDDSPPSTTSADSSPVSVELVRAPDERAGTPAVWLHRYGGRRVHRYSTADGWVVQQVSTKDPDNPKLRTIGEAHSFATEPDAVLAAGELAQGLAPTTHHEARPSARQVMAPAEA